MEEIDRHTQGTRQALLKKELEASPGGQAWVGDHCVCVCVCVFRRDLEGRIADGKLAKGMMEHLRKISLLPSITQGDSRLGFWERRKLQNLE